MERRGPPSHRTNDRMQELARDYEALLRQGDARAAADHYREHGQQTCPFHRLPYAWVAVTDGMHAVTSPHTHTTCDCRIMLVLHGSDRAAVQGQGSAQGCDWKATCTRCRCGGP